MNRDGWRVVAEGHGIMAAVLEDNLPLALARWDMMATALGHSIDEARAWHADIRRAYDARIDDLYLSEVERRARSPITQLCKAVKEAGGQMILYGRPVDEASLGRAALAAGIARAIGLDERQAALEVLDG